MAESGDSGALEAETSNSRGDQGASVQGVLAYHDASGGQITFTGLVFLGILKAVSGFRKFSRSLKPGRNDENLPA
ncbi:MAG: hypothetical protein GY701_10050 [Sulfitobacter sp.]|nr:hypothetical protein [Sulfitobacter sp.]MCP4083665.1 hypothetical protein [Actinomycetes bacterium]